MFSLKLACTQDIEHERAMPNIHLHRSPAYNCVTIRFMIPQLQFNRPLGTIKTQHYERIVIIVNSVVDKYVYLSIYMVK